MSFDRLNFVPILRGHWKGLTLGNQVGNVPDRGVRLVLLLALALVVPAYIFDWTLAAPEALLAAVAILAGGLLTGFGFLAMVRVRLQDRDPRAGTASQRAKDLLDESVGHLMAAMLACLVDATVLALGVNMAAGADEPLGGVAAALAIGLSAYVAVSFLLLLTRLYATYVDAVKVRPALSGLSRTAED